MCPNYQFIASASTARFKKVAEYLLYNGKMTDLERIAANLTRLMHERGLASQVRLADAAGISQTNLSNVLRLSVSPTLETLTRLATALKVETFELMAPPDLNQMLAKIRRLTPADRAILDRLLDSLASAGPGGH